MWGQARREAAKPYRSIHFAHSELSGVALFEEAFDHGVRTADNILPDVIVGAALRGRPFSLSR
jgi:hypothetical protein